MLLAPMVMPPEKFDMSAALQWTAQSPCYEVTDILCKELLVKLPFVEELVTSLFADGNGGYAATRLMLNMMRRQMPLRREWLGPVQQLAQNGQGAEKFTAMQILTELNETERV